MDSMLFKFFAFLIRKSDFLELEMAMWLEESKFRSPKQIHTKYNSKQSLEYNVKSLSTHNLTIAATTKLKVTYNPSRAHYIYEPYNALCFCCCNIHRTRSIQSCQSPIISSNYSSNYRKKSRKYGGKRVEWIELSLERE